MRTATIVLEQAYTKKTQSITVNQKTLYTKNQTVFKLYFKGDKLKDITKPSGPTKPSEPGVDINEPKIPPVAPDITPLGGGGSGMNPIPIKHPYLEVMLGEGLSPKAPRFLNDKDLNAIKDTVIDWGDGTVEPFLKKIKVKIPAPGPSIPRPAIDISEPSSPIVDVDGPNISVPKLPNPGEPRQDEPEQYETVYSLGSKHRYKDTFINGLIDSKEPVTIIVTNISGITEYFETDYQPALITVSRPDTYNINLDVLTSIEQIGSDVTTLEYAFSPDSNNRISNVSYYSDRHLPGEPGSSATNIRAFYDGRPDVPKYSEYGESSYRNRHIQGPDQMIFGLGEDIFCFKKNAFRYCSNISNIKGLFAHSTLVEDKETFFNNGSISKLNSILYSSKDESEKITADTYSKIKLAQIDNILEYFPSATNLDFAFLDTNYDIVSQKNLISSINALPNKVSTTNCLSIFRQSYIKDYIHNIKEYGGELGMPPMPPMPP